ncbi:EAL domain-containing response regulator [Maribrevibacterium harenarium]|uniref:EAL domain-containing response regulator n=1 Tax=Maribrevibacterium harenarium TaxID=2589817 RepID=A0A501X2I1_9GAMM|nr:EAL domain-containing response regulator [Maribrevibacterium harenarium]TPE54690.1 EAL domain-containing response regulator [Maribrevibacterium harenarium]
MPTILIVDDIEDNRYTLRRRLKRFGYEQCVEAESGYQALEVLRAQAIDLVFLDLMMPGMDGFDVLRAMRDEQMLDHLPVVMISAADDLENVAKGIELGAEDYLSKPFNPAILKARTESALEKRQRALSKLSQAKHFDDDTGLMNLNGLMEASLAWPSEAGGPIYHGLWFSFQKSGAIYRSCGASIKSNYLRSQVEKLQNLIASENLCGEYCVYRGRDDSIAMTLAGCDLERVLDVAAKIMRQLSGRIELDGISFIEDVRVGVAAPEALVDGDELIRQMISATESTSQNQPIALYQNANQSDALGKIVLEAELKRAIEDRELVVYLQPQVDANSGTLVGSEALVRWPHPERGMVSPGAFIPLAEEVGLMPELGDLVISLVLEALQGMGDKAVPTSINISSDHFLRSGFVTYFQRQLEESGVAPHLVKLELTESVLIANKEHGIKVMQALRDLGVKLSLDDFGTGYSSLSYLLELPLDQLKIDKQFVDALDRDQRSSSVMKHVISLAHELELEVVVEGVETQEQWQRVAAAGADLIQGFYFFRPLPLAEFQQQLP